MDEQTAWQAFAGTGNILYYLDYKQTLQPEQAPAEYEEDGTLCDHGSGAEGDPL